MGEYGAVKASLAALEREWLELTEVIESIDAKQAPPERPALPAAITGAREAPATYVRAISRDPRLTVAPVDTGASALHRTAAIRVLCNSCLRKSGSSL